MTSKEFVIWLEGFATAANPYNITPKQWEEIKEKLETVVDISINITPKPSEKVF